MTLPAALQRVPFPVIGSPLFIISNPKLVTAQCQAGIAGSDTTGRSARANGCPSSSPRSARETTSTPRRMAGAASCGMTSSTHVCAKGDRQVRRRPDCGGCRRRWPGRHEEPLRPRPGAPRLFDGPLALSGAIATGGAVLAAQAPGAAFAYIGSPFIATDEAHASGDYKRCIVESTRGAIVHSSLSTGVHDDYLKPSIRAAGLDPDHLPESDPSKMSFGGGEGSKPKAWKGIWGCGQGIGAVKRVEPAADLVARLRREYDAACRRVSAS